MFVRKERATSDEESGLRSRPDRATAAAPADSGDAGLPGNASWSAQILHYLRHHPEVARLPSPARPS